MHTHNHLNVTGTVGTVLNTRDLELRVSFKQHLLAEYSKQ